MREVGGALLEGPFLHGVGDFVRDVQVEGGTVVDDAPQLPIGRLGEALLHVLIVKEQLAPLCTNLVLCHNTTPFYVRHIAVASRVAATDGLQAARKS